MSIVVPMNDESFFKAIQSERTLLIIERATDELYSNGASQCGRAACDCFTVWLCSL